MAILWEIGDMAKMIELLNMTILKKEGHGYIEGYDGHFYIEGNVGHGCSEGNWGHGYIDGKWRPVYTDGKRGNAYTDRKGDMDTLMGRGTWLY